MNLDWYCVMASVSSVAAVSVVYVVRRLQVPLCFIVSSTSIRGNEWIIKFVDGKHAALANEADVLKKLNHTNLPQIIDIFQNRQGTFLFFCPWHYFGITARNY